MKGITAEIKLVSEFYGTFGTKYFIEIITQANTSVVEISETRFSRIMQEQDFSYLGYNRDKPLPANVQICNERKEYGKSIY